ncbi:MAG TPA: YeeE/YedE thiosulfate transporter family protein [Bacteroidales bacterium]|nr:YeeE/YedE family protein [Bacteroidales bacterium]HRX97405.1 YeeE/YedE thiosulfate transporter family protein [Bacteroidales bacterium]
MGPLIPLHIIPETWNHVIAVLLGMAFGFIMESSGFSSSRKIVGLFYGYDFTVLRVFFTATVVTAIGLYYFSYMGWIDMSFVYIHPTYLTAAIVGGLIMGLGFVSGGYCPGTSLIGAAIGRIDGIVFTTGLMIGIFLFSEAFPVLEGIYEGTGMFDGDFLGYITITEYFNISPHLFIFGFTVVAVAAFYFTNLIRKRVKPVNY